MHPHSASHILIIVLLAVVSGCVICMRCMGVCLLAMQLVIVCDLSSGEVCMRADLLTSVNMMPSVVYNSVYISISVLFICTLLL